MNFELFLVPVDFTECSLVALRYAIKFCPHPTCQIILINVVDSREAKKISDYIKEPEEKVKERLINQAKQNLRKFLSQIDNGEKKIKDSIVSYGKPFQEIAIKARELQADVVIMGGYGSQGKGQIDEIFFGSTVEKVIRLLPCPVLCVPMSWSVE